MMKPEETSAHWAGYLDAITSLEARFELTAKEIALIKLVTRLSGVVVALDHKVQRLETAIFPTLDVPPTKRKD